MTDSPSIRLTVVGDALLDVDAVGVARRLCPDAPVPVVEDVVEHARPGGAALAALMASRDGHQVDLVAAWGDDAAGERLKALLRDVNLVRVASDGGTPVKYRVRSGGQSLLRLDHGSQAPTYGRVPSTLRQALAETDVVLVSDYGHGITALPVLREALSRRGLNTPLVWDPHPRGSRPVAGAHLATPNQVEAAIWGRRYEEDGNASVDRLAAIARRAEVLVRGWQARALAVTMSGRGALFSYGYGAPVVTPTQLVESADPCGAGDRFAVSAAVALARGRVASEAVQDAVLAASAYVGAGGPASLDRSPEPRAAVPQRDAGPEAVVRRVRDNHGVVVATGGCFDLLHPGHVATLMSARQLGDCLIVCLNSDASVRRLKGPGRPVVPAADRAKVLRALACVDDVAIFDEETPVEVLKRLKPDVWVKGGDYAGSDLAEAGVLGTWGGQTVMVPYLPGHSTTEIVETLSTPVNPSTKEMSR